MDPMEEIRQTFFMECEELLEAMEAGLLAMSDGDDDKETVNAVFRAVHSIKGGAGAFGLEALVRFAHTFETTMDEVRSDRLAPSEEVMTVLLRSGDALSDLFIASRDGTEIEDGANAELLGELEALIGGSDASDQAEEDEPDDFVPMTISFDLDDDDDDDGDEVEEDSDDAYYITFKPHATLYQRGNEAVHLLRALSELGECEITCITSDLPELSELDVESAHLVWQAKLKSGVNERTVREVFEFVEEDCDLTISTSAPIKTKKEEEPDYDTEDVVCEEAVSPETETETETETDPVAEAQAEPAVNAEDSVADAPCTDEKPETKPVEAAATAPAAPAAPAATKKAKETGSKATVRVDLDRVDRLINLVGELVINQAMLSEGIVDSEMIQDSAVATGLEEFKQLTREIQESVMAIRAQPVKSLFQRMSRIVREASAATEKSVTLVTDGEATEVDKTVVERLADPLTHMIRNAVDHGLESTEDRAKTDKDPRGTVRLTAAHRSGRVIIEVADDGAGINRERVKQIAIDKGLIPEDLDLTNSEIDNLLFMPGFSTAKEVSDLSGRGVGMDVVKRSIQALGGKISISSNPGQGSVFSISLPLTLAVLDGMVVNVAEQTVVLPLTAIVETLKPGESDIHDVCGDAATILIRGTFVPVIDVGNRLGYREPISSLEDSVILLVETEEGAKAALAVDAILDQRQVVIKGLENNYGHVPGIAAATILGDGRIALILDPDAIVDSMSKLNMSIDNQIQKAG